jgi:hypothetical protein
VNLRTWASVRRPPARKHVSHLLELDCGADERPRVDKARRVVVDGTRQTGRSAEDSHRGNVLERQLTRVDSAGLAGQPDVHDTSARFDKVEGESRHGTVVGGIDHCVPSQVG